MNAEDANKICDNLYNKLKQNPNYLGSLFVLEEVFETLRNREKGQTIESELIKWSEYVCSSLKLVYNIDWISKEIQFKPSKHYYNITTLSGKNVIIGYPEYLIGNHTDYTKEVKDIFSSAFRLDWMDENEWREFEQTIFLQNGLSYELLSRQLEEGVKNGYSVEYQKQLIKDVLSKIS